MTDPRRPNLFLLLHVQADEALQLAVGAVQGRNIRLAAVAQRLDFGHVWWFGVQVQKLSKAK